MYGFLRPMFNNWLQNIFAAILTIMFSALALRIVIGFLTSRMSEAVTQASKANIVELGAQDCLAGLCASILMYMSAKLAGALAGASATATMQGAAALGIGAAAYGAGKMLKEAGKVLPKEVASPSNKGLGDPQSRIVFNAADARKHAIEQMIARNEARMLTDQSAPKLRHLRGVLGGKRTTVRTGAGCGAKSAVLGKARRRCVAGSDTNPHLLPAGTIGAAADNTGPAIHLFGTPSLPGADDPALPEGTGSPVPRLRGPGAV